MKFLYNRTLLFFLFEITLRQVSAQLVISPDTTICTPGSPVTIEVLSAPSFGTDSYTFETVPYSPEVYGGTGIYMTDDSYSPAIDIGFSFCFFGNSYTQCYIGSNGWVSFGGAGALVTTYTSAVIPSTAATVPKNCIMGPWQDWYPGYPTFDPTPGPYIFYQTLGSAPNRKFVVSWDNVPMYSCTGTLGKFQIVLNETTNLIQNNLTDKPNCITWAGGTATEGVHNLAGTTAFTAPGRNSTAWTASNESVQFVPNGITWYLGPVVVGYGDSLVVNPLTTSTYTASLTGCDGITYTADVIITVGLDDASFGYAGGPSYCQTGGIIFPSFTIIPGGTFTVSPTGLIIDSVTGAVDLSTGTTGTSYTITYTTPAGPCSSSSNQIITIAPFDDASFAYLASSYCPSGTVLPFTVATTGGTFTASPAGLTINSATGAIDLSTGTVGNTYTITYTTSGLCPSVSSQTITINPLDDPGFSYSASSYCPTGTATPVSITTPGGVFTVSPAGLSINPSTGTITLSTGIIGTTYNVSYTTPAGSCSSSSTQTITIDPLDDASFGYGAVNFCPSGLISPTFITTPGGTFSVLPSGITYDFISGQLDLSTAVVGTTYSITYTTPAGPCSNSTSVNITIIPPDDATFTYASSSYCTTGTASPTFIATGGGTFTCTPAGLNMDSITGLIDFASAIPGTYTITYSTPSGPCNSTSNFDITILPITDASFSYDSYIYCAVGTTIPSILFPGGVFSAAPEISINNSTGEINLQTSVPGGPYDIVYTSPGCSEADTFSITIFANPSVDFSVADVICIEWPPITLNGLPAGGTFTGTGVTGNQFDPALSGEGLFGITYNYIDANGCSTGATEYIQVIQNAVDLGPDVSIFEGSSTTLYASGGVSYEWTPSDGLNCTGCSSPIATPLQTTTYTVLSYDMNGCIATDDITVFLLPFYDSTIFVPNAFTPNGDNINDVFFIYGSDIQEIVSFSIFDRWGELLWERNNILKSNVREGWDGTYRNTKVNTGVYAYVANVMMNNGTIRLVKGNITLLN